MNDLLEKFGASRKRVIIAVILGLLLAMALIWIKSNLYDPFAEEYDDLLVFVTEDADLVIYSNDVPTLIKGIEDRPFISHLNRSKNFSQFLASDLVAETELIPKMREAFAFLRDIDAELPFDLSALGDLSGHQIVVSGYAPKKAGEPFTMVAAIQPHSDMALIAANALITPSLCGFVEDDLGVSEIEHFGWGVRLVFPDGKGGEQELGLARVEKVLLIGTNIPALSRLVKKARTVGLPVIPERRMDPRWVWSSKSSSALNVMARKSYLLEKVGLHKNILIPMWGGAIARSFEQAFPMFSGSDAYVQLDFADQADLRFAVAAEPRSRGDVFSDCDALDEDEVFQQVDRILSIMPHHVFGYAAMGNHPADVLSFALGQRAMVDQDQRELLFAGLAELESFKRYKQPGSIVPEFVKPLVDKLRTLFDPGMGLLFFKKIRSEGSGGGGSGFACILRIADHSAVRAFIQEIDDGLKQPFDYFDSGPFDYWRVSKKSFLEDAENNDPGFAIIDDYLVVTNWVRLFQEAIAVGEKTSPGMPLLNQIEYQLEHMTAGTKDLMFIDVQRLYSHMDQAKTAWVEDRSKIEEIEKFAQRQRLESRWRQTRPNFPQEEWVELKYKEWLRETQKERNPATIRREIDRNLNQFRDVFSYFFIDVGQEGPEFRIHMTLAAEENY